MTTKLAPLILALTVLLGATSCRLMGGSKDASRLAGTLLHGRYLAPNAAFSIRIPSFVSERAMLRDDIASASGALSLNSEWGSQSVVVWSHVSSRDAQPEEVGETSPFETEALFENNPDAELVHEESIAYRGDTALVSVVRVPKGSSWSRTSWWFWSERLDLELTSLRFRHGETRFLVVVDATVGLCATSDDQPPTISNRPKSLSRALKLANRIEFDDPLAIENAREAE